MLTEYIDFQVEVIRRRTKFDLDKAQARAHILEGMVIALKILRKLSDMPHLGKYHRDKAETYGTLHPY